MQQQTGSKLQSIILTHCREEVLMLLSMPAVLILEIHSFNWYLEGFVVLDLGNFCTPPITSSHQWRT